MKAMSLIRKIEKLGGTAEIVSEESRGYDGQAWASHEVVGELNGYDIHMDDLESDFYTVRSVEQRGHYDPGSDYNPGGYSFRYRLSDLEQYAARKVAA